MGLSEPRSHGSQQAGDTCRYAHGVKELRGAQMGMHQPQSLRVMDISSYFIIFHLFGHVPTEADSAIFSVDNLYLLILDAAEGIYGLRDGR